VVLAQHDQLFLFFNQPRRIGYHSIIFLWLLEGCVIGLRGLKGYIWATRRLKVLPFHDHEWFWHNMISYFSSSTNPDGLASIPFSLYDYLKDM
jgi:hypothetical protein